MVLYIKLYIEVALKLVKLHIYTYIHKIRIYLLQTDVLDNIGAVKGWSYIYTHIQ
jgi:hypothetical protein